MKIDIPDVSENRPWYQFFNKNTDFKDVQEATEHFNNFIDLIKNYKKQ
jgi:hypothetical protein